MLDEKLESRSDRGSEEYVRTRVVANCIPKSGIHLLDRLLMLLGLKLVDFGGIRPRPISDGGNPLVRQRVSAYLGLRKPENVMGIGSHLVSGGRFPPYRRLTRSTGQE